MLRTRKKPDRMPFGKEGHAWFAVEIANDNSRAFLREISLGGDATPGRDDLIEALAAHYHIVAGIDDAVVDQVIAQVRAEPHRTFNGRGNVVIAREVPARAPSDGEIDYRFLDMVTRQRELPYADLRQALGQPALSAVLERELLVRATPPEATIAVMKGPRAGSPATSIFGEVASLVPAPKRVTLSAGENVVREDDRYVSQIFGYVCVLDDTISVLPPIWVSPDALEARYIHFRHAGPQVYPELEWLQDAAARLGLEGEISPGSMGNLSRWLAGRTRPGSFVLLRGDPPVDGGDMHLEATVIGAESGPVHVRKDQTVARTVKATLGTPGRSLRGEPIAARDGAVVDLDIGENVQPEYDGDLPARFYARIEGNLHLSATAVNVHRVRTIEGDADATVGDIASQTDLVITGSVKDGLTVSSEGSIRVQGAVEQGATLRAKGDVVVEGGIIGNRTKVISLGDVTASFVQEGTVMSGGDTIIQDHLFHAKVRAGGDLVVCEGEGPRSGNIVGGEITASERVRAESIGNASGVATKVRIGENLEMAAGIRKSEESLQFLDTNIMRIFRTLGIQSLEKDVVHALIRRTPEWRRRPLLTLLSRLRELLNAKEETQGVVANLQRRRAEALAGAEIEVGAHAYAGVEVAIGEARHIVSSDLANVVFRATGRTIVWNLSLIHI